VSLHYDNVYWLCTSDFEKIHYGQLAQFTIWERGPTLRPLSIHGRYRSTGAIDPRALSIPGRYRSPGAIDPRALSIHGRYRSTGVKSQTCGARATRCAGGGGIDAGV
jgi:hypothetical protein